MDIHVRRINGQATDVDVHRTKLLTLEPPYLAVTKHQGLGLSATKKPPDSLGSVRRR
jgi:hypothetical protein